MQQEKTNKKLGLIFWVLTAVCMAVIFYFSSRTADESSLQSTFFLEMLTALFGEGAFTDFIVRKFAHFIEFTGTSLIAGAAFYFTLGKNRFYPGVLLISLYAVTDEVHQIFVDGRSCQFLDWVIDTLGAVLGAIIFSVLLSLVKKIIQKKKKSIDTELS